MTLYLKYRPQTVSELDLVKVRETLTNLLMSSSLPHAFLFTGPRGTGKTSAARILAKALNCEHKKKGTFEPCNECETCRSITKGTHIDVIEMDAASNRGIDEIRALKQDIILSPSVSAKKIYIVDEVHMLTTEAANALLKTLEEPPSHVVFILATTDPQKLPQTVISRLSVVQFHKASIEEITKKLKLIATKEKLNVEDNAMIEIAKLSEGSFRDAVKFLEELSLKQKSITEKMVLSLYNTGSNHSHTLLTKLNSEGVESAILFLGELSKEGIEGKTFLNSFINEIHSEVLKSVGILYSSKNILSQEEAVKLLELLLEAKSRMIYSTNDFLPLEIAILKFKPNTKEPEKKVQSLPPKKNQDSIEVKKPENPIQEKLIDLDVWGKILILMRQKNASVEALLRATRPQAFDGSLLTLGVYYKFHKERLEVPANRIIFEEVLTNIFGNNVSVEFVLEDPPVRAVEETSLTQVAVPDIISAAKEIFGN